VVEGPAKENPMPDRKSKSRTASVGREVAERGTARRVESYHWTPVNAPAKEILMEIRKDPNYKDPSPIKVRPPHYNRHKYCHYHDSFGHYTDNCISLKEVIEKYIADGKLKRFVERRESSSDKRPAYKFTGNQGSSGHDARSGKQQYYRERKPPQQPRSDVRAEKSPQREWSRSRGRPQDLGCFPEI
jgi:hypothetical protein